MIGKIIREIRASSFYLNRKVVCECVVVFLKTTDDNWYSISIGEGSYEVMKVEEPALETLDTISDDFAYPTYRVSYLDNYLGKVITGVYSYEMNDRQSISVGMFIECETDGFSIEEQSDCLIIHRGKNTELLRGTSLKRVDEQALLAL